MILRIGNFNNRGININRSDFKEIESLRDNILSKQTR